MTLLGVNTPLASGALRLFLAHDVTFSCAGETAHGVDAVLFMREDSLEPIREHTLSWRVIEESAGHWLVVRASYLPKQGKGGWAWLDTRFTLDSEGRLTHVQQSESYVMSREASGVV
jgi:hypothetical protein